MSRLSSTTLLASLLACLSQGAANADLTYITTPFSGTNFDYTLVTGTHPLPYTDSNGTILSASNGGYGSVDEGANLIIPGPGGSSFNGSGSFTWTLSSAVTEVGFTLPSFGLLVNLQSVSLSNGDSSTAYHPTTTYFGFSDTTAFNSVTLSFTELFGQSFRIDDFTFASPAAVPEPASLVNLALAGAASFAALAYRRRRRA